MRVIICHINHKNRSTLIEHNICFPMVKNKNQYPFLLLSDTEHINHIATAALIKLFSFYIILLNTHCQSKFLPFVEQVLMFS